VGDMRAKAARAKVMTRALNSFLQKRIECMGARGDQMDKYGRLAGLRRASSGVGSARIPEREGMLFRTGPIPSIDLTALVHVFPPQTDDEPWFVVCRFYCPEDNIEERSKTDGVPYDQWVEEGYVTTTPGNTIDQAWILEDLKQDMELFQIEEVPFDRWGSPGLTPKLDDMGLVVVAFGQGYASMSGPMKDLERMVARHEIAHGNNPVLTWMADNLIAVTDPAGNIKPDKSKSKEKIDGMVALIMGLDRGLRNQGEAGSVYDERGVVMI